MRTFSDSVRFLAALLCLGIRPSSIARSELEKFFGYEAGFVHGAVLLLRGSRPINTALFEDYLNRMDGPILDFADSVFTVSFRNHEERVEPLMQPKALTGVISSFGRRADLAKLHSPSTLFLTPIRECIFAVKKEICRFCNFNGDKMTAASPSDIATVVAEVANEIGVSFDIAIGSGTPNLNDGGARYFANIVREVRKINPFLVSVEMVPSKNMSDVELLAEAGISSIISSIEIWSDEIRSKVMPGKSKISKDRYLEWWSEAIKILGRGQVSSVLIADLDKPKSTKEGVDQLIKIGVIPTIIPFRPYDGIELSNRSPCDVDTYLDIVKHNTDALFRAGLSPSMQNGCTKCQGCSIDDPAEVLAS